MLSRRQSGAPGRRWRSRYRALLVGADVLALLLAAGVGIVAGPNDSSLAAAAGLIAAWLASLALLGTHNPSQVGSGTSEFRRVLSASARVALVVMAIAYVARSQSARDLVLVTLPAGTVLLLLGRASVRAIRVLAHRRGDGGHRILAVGTVRDVLHLIEQARRSPGAGFHVVAACVPSYAQQNRRGANNRRLSETLASHGQRSGDRRADSDRRGDVADLTSIGVPVLGEPHQVLDAVERGRADSVVVAGQGLVNRHALRRLAWQLQTSGTRLFLASALSDVAAPRITVRTLAGLPLLHVEAPVFGGGQRMLKAAIDRLLAGTLVVLLAPLLLVLAALVGLTSPGGVLYRQERIGLGQRPFRCLKFRTMRAGADSEVEGLSTPDEKDSVLFKMRVDPRVTRVGRILRRCSLDELPQLFNVLGGSMSLVGPRPPRPAEVAGAARRAFPVKPGLTGLWQVGGDVELSWEENARLDLRYVQHWSLIQDAVILGRAVGAIRRNEQI